MKPRNKHEQYIMELHEQLPDITEKQREWGFNNCFPHEGFATKHTIWCQSCGEVSEYTDDGNKTYVCPHCGEKIKIVRSIRKCYDEKFYYMVIASFRGYQIFRIFIVEKWMRKDILDKKPAYKINEAVQIWINEDGETTVVARPTVMMPMYYDKWNFNAPMSIKDYEGKEYKYFVYTKIYPSYHIIPKAKRNGFNMNVKCCPARIMKAVLTDNNAEMLIKTGQYDLLAYLLIEEKSIKRYIHAVKICNRNHYKIKEPNLWLDMVSMLESEGYDTHNAHYVCPPNVRKAHDEISDIRNKRLEKEARKANYEHNYEIAKKAEAEYEKTKGRFFGVHFAKGGINVSVIGSVSEMFEEGERMHHCVFLAEYYKKVNSLILSAKDDDGNRLETVEVNIKNYKIVQSQGHNNENSKQHDRIISLVNANMYKIKRVNKKTKSTKKRRKASQKNYLRC